ncbi:hypothetical protein CGGC5_v005854 [Colletotrichum fructicola Nara gc5]|uniref:Uncharacterized protein n=1 Tax=Colletotrichum fructicola (strain Nara gc5) TaxID=1213859 RepID=A0A7J6JB47_COLFN|nr:hypothetical protein CGGC5_v005854 [Colletotrichum fructicola Nara gc5]
MSSGREANGPAHGSQHSASALANTTKDMPPPNLPPTGPKHKTVASSQPANESPPLKRRRATSAGEDVKISTTEDELVTLASNTLQTARVPVDIFVIVRCHVVTNEDNMEIASSKNLTRN